MRNKLFLSLAIGCLALSLVGCANKNPKQEMQTEKLQTQAMDSQMEEVERLALEDGEYLVDFDTDSTMFHVNEVMNKKAKLTVENGVGTLHLVMPSKNVLHLYLGLAEDAKENEADWIAPTTEEVTYEDGLSEEVYAFDVPLGVIGEEFDLALIGKKEVWYDHKVSASNPVVYEAKTQDEGTVHKLPESKEQTVGVMLEGGTGKVTLISPTAIKETDDGYLVTIEWSSKNYDYMIVDEVKYLPVEVNEHSIFEIPVESIETPLEVIADTVAMSTPHEIAYTITFLENTMN